MESNNFSQKPLPGVKIPKHPPTQVVEVDGDGRVKGRAWLVYLIPATEVEKTTSYWLSIKGPHMRVSVARVIA